jgi:hypothetical protein
MAVFRIHNIINGPKNSVNLNCFRSLAANKITDVPTLIHLPLNHRLVHVPTDHVVSCAHALPLALLRELEMLITDMSLPPTDHLVFTTFGSVAVSLDPMDKKYARWTMDQTVHHDRHK